MATNLDASSSIDQAIMEDEDHTLLPTCLSATEPQQDIVDVSILIVSYNTRVLLDSCLASVQTQTSCIYEVIVVDNASHDGSSELVQQQYPAVKLIQNSTNAGFSIAVNQASRAAQGCYLLLLNSDSVLWTGAIDRLVTYMDAHPDVGICAPANLSTQGKHKRNYQQTSTPWHYCRAALRPFIPSVVRAGKRSFLPTRHLVLPDSGSIVQDVEVVHGNSLMIRASLFKAVGGLDEAFFMYVEDVDLCLRVRQAKQQIRYVPESVITHHGGRSSADQQIIRINGMIGYHIIRSRYHYVQKHFGRSWMWMLRLCYILASVGWFLLGIGSFHAATRSQRLGLAKLLFFVSPLHLRVDRSHNEA
jgi:GT2 family glycosyltransferase